MELEDEEDHSDSQIKTLERDTGLKQHDLRAVMMNRDVWEAITVQ